MRLLFEDELTQLWHGDYHDSIDILAAAKPDAVVTDPPYGETKFDWDCWPTGWLDDVASFTDALWCFGSFRMFHEHSAEFADWRFSQDIVWEKHNGTSLAADRFRRVHELATLWYRGKWTDQHHKTPTTPDGVKRSVRAQTKPTGHQNKIEKGYYATEKNGDRLMRSVMSIRTEHGRAVHPTQKPLGIVTPLIEYSVPPGGLVVDIFGGSFTTALAARLAGRRSIAFEREAHFAAAGARRFEQQAFDLSTLTS